LRCHSCLALYHNVREIPIATLGIFLRFILPFSFFHFPNGHSELSALVLKPREQPHPPFFSSQHGWVPGTKHPFPSISISGHFIQICILCSAISSMSSFLNILFFIPSIICPFAFQIFITFDFSDIATFFM